MWWHSCGNCPYFVLRPNEVAPCGFSDVAVARVVLVSVRDRMHPPAAASVPCCRSTNHIDWARNGAPYTLPLAVCPWSHFSAGGVLYRTCKQSVLGNGASTLENFGLLHGSKTRRNGCCKLINKLLPFTKWRCQKTALAVKNHEGRTVTNVDTFSISSQ